MKLRMWSTFTRADGHLTGQQHGSSSGRVPVATATHGHVEGLHSPARCRVQQNLEYDLVGGFRYDTKVIQCPLVEAEHAKRTEARASIAQLRVQRHQVLNDALMALLPFNVQLRLSDLDTQIATALEEQRK